MPKIPKPPALSRVTSTGGRAKEDALGGPMKRVALVLLAIGLLLVSLAVFAGPVPIISMEVHDADTAYGQVSVYGEPMRRRGVRLKSVNAAEISLREASKVCNRGGGPDCIRCELEAGQLAANWAKEWTAGKLCYADSPKECFGGRLCADIICNGESWTAAGLAAGFLKPSRNRREPWCGVVE